MFRTQARAKGKKVDRATARRQFLALKPLRNPAIEWEAVENGVILTIASQNNWATKLLNIFLPLSDEERKRRIALDAIAGDVWKLCDGKTSIEAISKALQSEYNLGSKEAELSLQQFFQTLGKRGFVGFAQTGAPANAGKKQA